VLASIISTPIAAPVLGPVRLRGGTAGSAREAGCTGTVIARLDSAFYNSAVTGTAIRHGVHFSITVPMNASIKDAIADIPEDAWTAIKYPRAIWDDQPDCWISEAEVAETGYTAFTSKKKSQQVTARLIVRRVRALSEKAAQGQGELFPAYRHHAVFPDSPFETIPAETGHRDHAIVEQVFADLNDGPLAHLPSGGFNANAAWLVLAAMAHNLLRSAGTRAGTRHAKSRTATLRRDLVTVPARIARRGRGDLILHLPVGHHREQAWLNLWADACGPPAAAA
jgi:hypothetical protein